MRPEHAPLRVHDRAFHAVQPLATEERPIVVAAEKARFLTLRAPCSCEARDGGLRSRIGLRLLAEREAHTVEQRRIDGTEHVRLILVRIDAASDELHAVTLDDPRVMTRPQLVGSRTLRECHELVESKRAVAAHARIGSLAGAIRVDERVDDRALELLAEVERHVRDPEAVTRRSRSRDRRGRAAGTLGVRRSGVLPQAKGHADRVLTRATQRDRAVHPAAHRNGDAAGPRFGCEGRSERCCERLDRERLAPDRRRFDQVEPVEITIEPAERRQRESCRRRR